MHTASAVFTIHISTILFTGTAGITILFTIHPVGRLHITGDGVIHTTAGDTLFMAGEAHITAGDIRITVGDIIHTGEAITHRIGEVATIAQSIEIPTIINTDNVDPQVRMLPAAEAPRILH